jgi:hypothetical protein
VREQKGKLPTLMGSTSPRALIVDTRIANSRIGEKNDYVCRSLFDDPDSHWRQRDGTIIVTIAGHLPIALPRRS